MVHVDHSRHPVYLSGRSTRGVSPTIANNCSLSKGNETGRRPYASHDTQQLKATAIFFLPALYLTPHACDIHRSCSTNFQKPTSTIHASTYIRISTGPRHSVFYNTVLPRVCASITAKTTKKATSDMHLRCKNLATCKRERSTARHRKNPREFLLFNN